MRFKIRVEDKRVHKNKTKFLFLPRFCEKCLTCFWLEFMTFRWSEMGWWTEEKCPECGGFLWTEASRALDEHK